MPLKQHPTKPDMMIYTKTEYGNISVGKEWIGLTDEEIREFEIWLDNDEEKHGWNPPENIVRYLEAKLKEKNT